MKRCARKRLLSVIALMTIILDVYVENVQGEWVHYFTTTGGEPFYYDQNSVDFSSEEVAVVLGKIEIHPARLIETRTAKRFSIKGYEDYDYTVQKYEINCQDKEYRILSQTDYDKEGKVLESDTPDSSPRWQPIPPNSAINGLSLIICYVEKKRLKRLKDEIEKDLERRRLGK